MSAADSRAAGFVADSREVSIVMPCLNEAETLEICIRKAQSWLHGARCEGEIIVADNGSTDGSIEEIRRRFPSVRVVENGANLGFAKGNNTGIAVAQGEYTLILNPDTIILRGALDRLIEYAERHPEAAAFGCRGYARGDAVWAAKGVR